MNVIRKVPPHNFLIFVNGVREFDRIESQLVVPQKITGVFRNLSSIYDVAFSKSEISVNLFMHNIK